MPITTPYQVQYEACALVFLLAVTVRFFSLRRFPSKSNALFGLILLLAIADLTLDIITANTMLNADKVVPWVNYTIILIFYGLQLILPALMMLYVFFAADKDCRKIKSFWLLMLPMLLSLAAVILNCWTRWIYFIDTYEGTIHVFHGEFFASLYVETFFYLVVTMWLVHHYRGLLAKKQRRTIAWFIMILLLSILVQYLFPSVLLTGVALSLAILLLFFTLQNPDDMLDMISGVFNYNAMILYLDSAVSRNDEAIVLTVDVGEVRRINSTMGLMVGNQVLSQVGKYLDGLDKSLWVFRMVGTRFLLATTAERDVDEIAGSIQSRFEREWQIDGNMLQLTATVCYTDKPYQFHSPEEVILLIDEAYAGIEPGNWGSCQRINPNALSTTRRKEQIEAAIREALESETLFSLHYQPIRRMADGGYQTAEALLRLRSPQLGSVSPGEFIPLAERKGSILSIDDYVIRTACGFLARHPKLECLHINLSASEFFRNPKERIHAIVQASGVEPGRICFEVTETAANHFPGILAQFMEDMIRLGYLFALDDFGMGYSNITRLVSLPFSIAKIDKSLAVGEGKAEVMLDSVIGMFQGLGMKTVIEGIETQHQAEQVIKKVDYIQGFLYAKPMPENEWEQFVEQL